MPHILTRRRGPSGAAGGRKTAALTVGLIVATLVLATAGPAAATWVQTQTPTISGERGSGFGGVACTSRNQCIAVGSYTDSASTAHVLAESWDGTAWTTMATSDPFGASTSGLDGISCRPGPTCVAVGSYIDSGGNTLPLADVWDGSTWTLWGPSLPQAAVGGALAAVKCPTTTSCFAVGTWTDAGNATHALLEHWDTSSWSVRNVPTPSGATESDFDGIACPAAQLCLAVGQYRDAANDSLSLGEVWRGNGWSIQPTPNQSGIALNQLDAVSCLSATSCEAVGSGFAASWDGSVWTLQTIATPNPHTGGPAVLLGVSCRTASCAAVGYYELDAVQTRVAETWNGARWVLQSVPISNPNDSSSLAAVSCPGWNVCMTAGSFHNSFFNQNHTLAATFSLVWQQQTFTSPGPSIAGSVDAISCATTRSCAAVGSFETASDFETYAETWDGTQWTVTAVPNPSTTNLSGVSCTSPTACTAVGSSGDAINGFVTLAERWNGTNWTVQATPNHAGTGQGTYFTGVSCAGPSSCMAVGAYRDSSGDQFPFAAKWNGTTWTTTNAAAPAGATISDLTGVSCTSGAACVAVGSQGPSNPTALAEVWNGTSWTIHNPSFGSDFPDAALQGVDCQSSTSCLAVGSVFSTPANRRFAVAEKWDGTSWTDEHAVVPANTRTNFLTGVSCASTTDCAAVGTSFGSANTGTPLTETWDGSAWTLRPAVVPTGSTDTRFSAVSCPSQLLCVGSGSSTQSNNNETFLVEQYS